MPEHHVTITRTGPRAIVSLRVSRRLASAAQERMQLPAPLRTAGFDPESLWLAPDHWLLLSESRNPNTLIDRCAVSLGEVLHNARDYTAALTGIRLEGDGSRELLAAGTCLDLRPENLPVGACAPTRLARIATVVVVRHATQFELFAETSFANYLVHWLRDSAAIAGLSCNGGRWSKGG